MNYFLGSLQPDDPIGYWLKAHAHADTACLVIREEPGRLLRAACGGLLDKQDAVQGARGVRLCEGCVGRLRARILRKYALRHQSNAALETFSPAGRHNGRRREGDPPRARS